MKSIGIVRHLDSLGRIVLPRELRRTLGLGEREPLEIFVEGDRIILRKYSRGCSLCGSTEKLYMTGLGKLVCNVCITSFHKAQLFMKGSTNAHIDERN